MGTWKRISNAYRAMLALTLDLAACRCTTLKHFTAPEIRVTIYYSRSATTAIVWWWLGYIITAVASQQH